MRYRSVYSEPLVEKATRRLGLYGIVPIFAILGLAVLLEIPDKPELDFSVRQLEVVAVERSARAAGLEPGDRITTIAGRPVSTMPGYFTALARHRTLDPLPLEVTRNGRALAVVVVPHPPSQARLTRSYSQWGVGLAFLVIGWWVLRRRHDPVARNFFALCMIFAFVLMEIPDRPYLDYMWFKESLRWLLQLLLPAYFLRFFVQFPAPRRTPSGQPDKLRWMLIPGWTLFLLTTLGDVTGLTGLLPRMAAWLEGISLLYMLGFIVAGLVIFARKIRRRDRPIEHTKMRVVLIGILCGLTPFLSAAIVGNLMPGAALPQWQYLAFSLLLVPASFALAIMRFGALDKDFILRTSLIYGLLTAMVLGCYFVVVVGIGLVFGRLLGVRSEQITLAMVAGCGLLALPLRNLAQRWVDRAFYPARQANRRAMNRLAGELTELIDADEAIALLHERLQALFMPTTLAIYLVDSSGSFFPVSGPVTDEEPPPAQPPDGTLVRLLGRIRYPLFTEEVEDLLLEAGSDQDSMALLTVMQPQLLVPLITGNRLLGFLALGDKKGKALYSQEDLANLLSLAIQAAPLIESRQLYRESLHQKRLEAELEVAREIQTRLLPTETLRGEGFVIQGRNEPSRMVGGDFFDYFQLPDGSVALAIADVSGKGIPAALLMTSLSVAFRNEANPASGAREVIARLNRTVHGLVTPGQFVCFFFGILDPRSGGLTYCNAGMDPPVLFRAAAGIKEFLRRGGPVLGVDSQREYREGHLTLQPGDFVLFYTDGLTEQRNRQGEFFDIERLCEEANGPATDTCGQRLDRIFCRVSDFGDDREPDDKTAMLLIINQI